MNECTEKFIGGFGAFLILLVAFWSFLVVNQFFFSKEKVNNPTLVTSLAIEDIDQPLVIMDRFGRPICSKTDKIEECVCVKK